MIDDRVLSDITHGAGEAVAIYGQDGRRIAMAVSDDSERDQIAEALSGDDPIVSEVLEQALRGGVGTGVTQISDLRYRMHVHKLELEGDPLGGHIYLMGFVSQQVTDEARSTTTSLIAMWSVIAAFALVVLGGWVARRVSDPLVELTEGARHIAEGDFTTKIESSGTNEIAELAVTFNQMTDSLQERSETLTKKVLELATLYEMSRALGSTLDMDVLLESVLDSALRIFNVDLGYATLRDRETGKLKIRAWRGSDLQADEKGLRNSMSEWVVREGRPLIFNPTRGLEEERVDAVTGALAALCVPLVSNEGTVGSITVGSHDPSFRFNSDDVRLLSTIANHVTIAIGNIELYSNLQEAYLSTVRSLAAAVDAKDPFTRGHSDGVAKYAVMIAKEMDLSYEQQTAIEVAAYLHDIGKIGIKEEILLKPGVLTDAEMAQMRHHPLIGANILRPVGFPWPITPVVRHHHERWDGDGYPAGLRGEETPLLARILTVADAFEAMIADRPYRIGLTIPEAVTELQRCSGTQFDSKIVDVFIKTTEDEFGRMEPLGAGVVDEPHPEEAQAIFVALCDGMFSSFRKLGGPRLASNIEDEINAFFTQEELPFKITHGRMSTVGSGGISCIVEIEHMRIALEQIDATMSRTSGNTLVDHFYTDAMAGLSERMRAMAVLLDFCRA
jgi:putative nucleotidyltransferase with HDIG domain